MNPLSPRVIVIPMTVYGRHVDHVGILFHDLDLQPWIVSASKHHMRCCVEPLREVEARADGPWRLTDDRVTDQALAQALADAELGRRWSLGYNCEHYVRRWLGVPEESPQLQYAVGQVGQILAGLLIVGGLVAVARAAA